jgi:opacity protein-like surface antigen
MSIFTVRSGFAFVVAALCLAGGPAHAQSAPVTYWTPGWLGFGGNLNAGQGANSDGDFLGFGGSDAGGFSSTRYNFSNGWFVGNERGGMGLSMNGISQAGAFGSLYSEGVQFGYNFKNAPVTVYAGFDSLKYNSGIGSAFSPFDSTSSTPGYSAHAGVEFKPTSNLSLSLGVGYTQQSGRIDSDTKSPSLSNASQFDLVGGRR